MTVFDPAAVKSTSSSRTSSYGGPLTEQQWHHVNRYVKLPAAARVATDKAIHMARERSRLWKHKPSVVERNLRSVSQSASKLMKLLENLDYQHRIELLEGSGSFRIDEAIAFAKRISEGGENAATQVSKAGKKFRIDALIADLDQILQTFAGTRACQEKKVMSFITTVSGIADKEFSAGTVVSAVKRLMPRGKFRRKTISKSATDSRR
ncbi:hypothetical protein [Bradyrhizobium sp. JYMT SZCCT0428]|uniref:hypothetical protein n=1 Tax=Bradyrhizobium sp. JYMT SZCCT0428 TaxID=2807673 RepID=UPI001BA7C312|nr:hypothetical protein [Bradyrhizobium sp. JYMT SZCCT0428]MBR1156809.1 hypothetical protein [Bradyrhizobium sp. JYMT SZCCT0428]